MDKSFLKNLLFSHISSLSDPSLQMLCRTLADSLQNDTKLLEPLERLASIKNRQEYSYVFQKLNSLNPYYQSRVYYRKRLVLRVLVRWARFLADKYNQKLQNSYDFPFKFYRDTLIRRTMRGLRTSCQKRRGNKLKQKIDQRRKRRIFSNWKKSILVRDGAYALETCWLRYNISNFFTFLRSSRSSKMPDPTQMDYYELSTQVTFLQDKLNLLNQELLYEQMNQKRLIREKNRF